MLTRCSTLIRSMATASAQNTPVQPIPALERGREKERKKKESKERERERSVIVIKLLPLALPTVYHNRLIVVPLLLACDLINEVNHTGGTRSPIHRPSRVLIVCDRSGLTSTGL